MSVLNSSLVEAMFLWYTGLDPLPRKVKKKGLVNSAFGNGESLMVHASYIDLARQFFLPIDAPQRVPVIATPQ